MGDRDSDDEYERKRRDKFRGERSNEYRDVSRRPPPNDDMRSRRDDWDRDWGRGRGPPRSIDYRLGNAPRVPHEFSPPNKRARVDWDRYSHDSFSSGYGSGFDHPHGGYPPPPHHPPHRDSSDGHPQLLSFKAWLSTQDDSISDQDALAKYAEYKQEFKRQQLNEFFVAHRDEEWFRNKYHPDDGAKRKEELTQNLKKRVDLFMEFMEKGRFEGISLDSDMNSEKIIKLMDWYVIRLEGGDDAHASQLLSDEPVIQKITEEKSFDKEKAEENGDSQAASDAGSASDSDGEKRNDDENTSPKKRRSSSASEDKGKSKEKADGGNDSSMEEDGSGDELKKNSKKRKRSSSARSSASEDGEETEKKERKDTEKKERRSSILDAKKNGEDELPQLHRTASIFIRNLAPTITKQEVESLCRKYNGFIRVAIADPQPEKRWFRRGWVTFKRHVNIKEICWNLQNVRLRDTELGPIVNRDLSRRVRTVNGITPHKTIVRNDIRLAAKLIQHLDAKWNLWEEDKEQRNKESYGVYSTNPVLKNITNYLIEEASAEEEELLGLGGSDGELDGEVEEKANTIERDEELIRVLDRLILYLRFVHSLDYYNHAEYPYEDEMPNRLGIIHGRGMPPTSKVSSSELQEYNKNFEQKISTFMQPELKLSDEDCKVLGMKDEDTEVEKFISANTQELGKDKWLCPLSGKKFKGPDFVRKHILNKHAEKLEEVKKEVLFFNTYLRDPKRPHTPDPSARPPGDRGQNANPNGPPRPRESMMHERDYGPPPMYPPHPYGGYGGYGPPGRIPPYAPYRDFPPRGRPYRPGGRDQGRGIVSYRDLDAPAEPDDF